MGDAINKIVKENQDSKKGGKGAFAQK